MKRAAAAVAIKLLFRDSDSENRCFVVEECCVGVGPLEWCSGPGVGSHRSCAPDSSLVERPILVGVWIDRRRERVAEAESGVDDGAGAEGRGGVEVAGVLARAVGAGAGVL